MYTNSMRAIVTTKILSISSLSLLTNSLSGLKGKENKLVVKIDLEFTYYLISLQIVTYQHLSLFPGYFVL